MGAGRIRRLSRQVQRRGAWERGSLTVAASLGLESRLGVAFCCCSLVSGRLPEIFSLGAISGARPARESAFTRLGRGEEL